MPDLSIEVLRATFEEYRKGHEHRHDKDQEALRLQHAENMRRFDELNHAHQKGVEDKAELANKKVVEVQFNDTNRRIDNSRDESLRKFDDVTKTIASVNTALGLLQQQVDTLKALVYGAVGLVLLSVAGALLALVLRK